MTIPSKYLLSQGPALRAVGRAAVGALVRTAQRPAALPGAWIEEELPPRSEELVRAYVRHVGGDPAHYRGRLPPHFAPQWAFDVVGRVLAQAGYPLTRVINAGFRLENRAPLALGEPLFVKARLESVDDDGRRAKLVARVITGTRQASDALVAEWRTHVPLPSRHGAVTNGHEAPKAAPRPPVTVPLSSREIAYFRLKKDAGLDFAKLTGDINPIHWVAPLARAAGFRSCILHGFSTFARAYEALVRNVFSGNAGAIRAMEARFTRPLVLPAQVGVYLADGDGFDRRGIFVGDAPGAGAYLEGEFESRGAEA
ncbi:MaoC/PaaZ C-terminal domain-containing protein [Pendulispora albinea]|uniref:MaoC-like domain-containing protein n=1 Tax=Pendulispora albinea TaxID=2741071 RepID=A0ABZ2LUU5_9BACT